MYIYYNYAPDRSKFGILSYVYDFVYCNTSEELVKWFVDTLVNRFHVNFLVYEHWLFPLVSHNSRTIQS